MNRGRQLRCYMSLLAFDSFPQNATAPQKCFGDRLAELKAAGFEGVQFDGTPAAGQVTGCRNAGMGMAASGRINLPKEADEIAARTAASGCECVTVHAGWGIENDVEASRLIESILSASERHKTPIYFETHRATITQDIWRTVQFVNTFPEMRFNGDFSHWYAGQEMVYGGFGKKVAFLAPVLARVRFLHGRIANPGCIQAPVVEGATFVEHFKQLWTGSFRGFLVDESSADTICFAPELLGPEIYYAQIFGNTEPTNRYLESLKLMRIAQECFANAQQAEAGEGERVLCGDIRTADSNFL